MNNQSDGFGITRRTLLTGAAAAGGIALLNACSPSGSADKGEVVVLGWQTYLTNEIIQGFQKETGIRLRAVVADSDQSMFSKVKAGGTSQYDVVWANCGFSPVYQENDLIEAFDPGEVAASKELYPTFLEDPTFPYLASGGQVFMIPNAWAANGFAWNSEAPWQPTEPLSWNQLWEVPEGRVNMHGSGEDMLAIAGLANGVPRDEIYSMSGATLDAASAKLRDLRPFLLNLQLADPITAQRLASQEAFASLTSSFGVVFAANDEYFDGEDVIKVAVPDEGTVGWVDGMQLVKGAKNRENAIIFMDWWMGSVWNQDRLWNEMFFASCNKVTTERILEEGGEGAEIMKTLEGDKPELATSIAFQRPPDDPSAWAAAYDQAMG